MPKLQRYNSPRVRSSSTETFPPRRWNRLRQKKNVELTDLHERLAEARSLIRQLQQQLAQAVTDDTEVFAGLDAGDAPDQQPDITTPEAFDEQLDPSTTPDEDAETDAQSQDIPTEDNPPENQQDNSTDEPNTEGSPDGDSDEPPAETTPADKVIKADEQPDATDEPVDESQGDAQGDDNLTERLEAAERQAAETSAELEAVIQQHAELEAKVTEEAAQKAYMATLAALDQQYGGDLRAEAIDQANEDLAAMGFDDSHAAPEQLVKDRLEIAYLQGAYRREAAKQVSADPSPEVLDSPAGGNAGAFAAEGTLEEVIEDMKRAGKLR